VVSEFLFCCLRVEDTLVELRGFGNWLNLQLVLQRQRAAPVLLHRTVPPAGSGIIAQQGTVCGFEGGANVQQVLGHLDRPLARPRPASASPQASNSRSYALRSLSRSSIVQSS
jgi:hypothetical protein